jgi:protein MpaA
MSEDVEQEFLKAHRAHDPVWLIHRWLMIARRARLDVHEFASAGERKMFILRPRRPRPFGRKVYLSAGIHGDEPAGALGLLIWAKANIELLRDLDVTIFPCLNPWGLENNVREDERGRDLNRLFQSRAAPFPAWRRELGKERFDIAICLHEDYDAQGTYLYDLGGQDGERLLAAAAQFIQPDPRPRIEGSKVKAGLIRPSDVTLKSLPLSGLPEAIWLYFERCGNAITFETPSEFSLYRRAHAHAAVLSAALCEKS